MQDHNITIGFLDTLTAIAYAVFVLGGLIGLLIRRCRGACGSILFCASYVIGLDVYVWSLVLVFHIWGLVMMIIGLLIAGFGVVPMAILATAIHGDWIPLGYLLINIAILFVCRLVASKLQESARRYSESIALLAKAANPS
jgi:MFS family permease